MSIPLLATKFSIPPADPHLVRRARLSELLDAGVRGGCRLILVCAPAGYGKTSLVSQWVHQQKETPLPSATPAGGIIWLTLDPGDNDLARFVAYLAAALQNYQAELGQGVLAVLQNLRAASPQVLATSLINDLARLVEPVILILDDYHTLQAQPVQDFMAYFIEHQPQQMRLVILSRSDPPLQLARLRARGQLVEIRQLELALTGAEATEFLTQRMQLDLSPEGLQVLEDKTEGWAAGLQLAALSLRRVENIPAFIRSFSGTQAYIADYLTGEVLEGQTEGVREFLLQTSILNQLTAPLCEAVTTEARAAQILEELVDANLFLVPLDYHGEWYRYHALFADLLRKRLSQLNQAKIDQLHLRAGRWYAQHRMVDEAVEHFLAGQDYAAAAGLIEENAERILMHGQTATFLRWLEAFPMQQRSAYPVLVVYQGLAMMLLGKIPENALSLAQQIAAASDGKYRGEADTLQALFSVMKGDALEAIRLSESALQGLPPERGFLRILAADSLAMGYALRGDTASAVQAFEKMVAVAQAAGNHIMALMGLTSLAGLRYQQGRLHQAWEDYQQVLEMSRHQVGERSQAAGKVLLGLGDIAREWNDLTAAHRYLLESVEMFSQFVDVGLSVAYLSLCRVYLSQGEWDKAQDALEAARMHAQASRSTPLDDSLTELMQARLWIALGELDQAEAWARRRGLFERSAADLTALADRSATALEILQGEYLTLARLLLAQKRAQKALDFLDVLLAHNEKRSQMRRVIEVLALQALAYQQGAAHEPAMRAFSRALALAEPEGYARTFLDEGQPAASLLRDAAAGGHSPAYARRLLAGFSGQQLPTPQPAAQSGAAQSLIEPLSQRELEVLRLIAAGLTNQEIGRRLHISLSTVKGHTTHIYGKLGVSSRTQAAARAQSLGLV